MHSKSVVVSLALLAATSPALAAPVPAPITNAEVDARALKLPAGALGGLLKSLGSGILTGGALSGLLSLLGGDDTGNAARDLEARGALAKLLEKLIGAGEQTLGSVIKNAVIGGAASGVAVEGVNAVAGERRAGVPAAVVDDVAKVAEKGIASVIGNGVASGIGSALGGLGIGAILDKLFNKRAFTDLSDEEVVALLEYINDTNTQAQNSKRAFTDLSDDEVVALLEYINDTQNGTDKRALQLGSVGKGIAGLLASLAATQGAEAAIEQIKGLFGREMIVSLNELD